MGDLEGIAAALRRIESAAPSEPRSGEALPRARVQVLDVVAAAPLSARPRDTALASIGSTAARAAGETLIVIFAAACGMGALAFAWLLARP
jgi:NaMN:DMB phosphoribosyltransferase